MQGEAAGSLRGLSADTRLIALVSFAHGVSHFFHLLLPPLFPWLMPEFDLGFAQAGVLMAAFSVFSGIGQVLAGFLVDRVGPHRVLLGGIGCFVLASVVLALADRPLMLFAAAALAGSGNSVFHPADFSILNQRVSVARLGQAFSVHGLAGNLGWAAAPLMLASLATLAGWRWAALGAGVLAALAWLALWRAHELATHVAASDATAVRESTAPLGFLRVGVIWLCFLFFVLVTAAFAALQHFGTPLLHAMYELSVPAAAAALTAFLVGGGVGIIAGGMLVARGVAQELLIGVALAVAAMVALVLASGVVPAWGVVPLLVAMGLACGVPGPARDLLVRRTTLERCGQQSYGRVYGFVYAGVDVGVALSPLVFGVLMEASRFAAVFGGVALLQVFAIAVTVGVARSAPVAGRVPT